jgi:dihydropteroate synthase
LRERSARNTRWGFIPRSQMRRIPLPRLLHPVVGINCASNCRIKATRALPPEARTIFLPLSNAPIVARMFRRKTFRVKLPSRTLVLGQRTLIMGILNVTPDSFSDGGLFLNTSAAVSRALQMEKDGANIVDIGGESTRPGSEPVSPSEQLDRILPVLEKLQGKLNIPISVDTSSAEVAERAATAGAEIINDVTGLRGDAKLADVVRRRKLGIIVMHMHGEPRTMQKKPFARNVMQDVMQGLRQSVITARKAGIPASRIILDPGIGFGKTYQQDYELIARLEEFAKLGYPLLAGTSRKKFIGRVLDGRPTGERLFGTAATVAACVLHGAHIVRVHDVSEMSQVARVADAVLSPASVAILPKFA